MRKAVLIAALILFPGCWGACVSSGRAEHALHAEGWTDVTVGAGHWISPHIIEGCSTSDDVAFSCSGLNPAGHPSSATVCCGFWFKGCTIRH